MLRYFQTGIFISAFLTGLLLWLAQGSYLDANSLQFFYRAQQIQFSNLFSLDCFYWWLFLLPNSLEKTVLLMNFLSASSLLLFTNLALKLGLEKRTVIFLFFLLNFNPEYNDSRLNIEAFQFFMPIFLLNLNMALNCKKFSTTLIALTLPLWIFSWLDRWIMPWNLLLPLLMLFYPVDSYKKRLRDLLIYYLLAFSIVFFIPEFKDIFKEIIHQTGEQFGRASFEMSIFFSADNSVQLSNLEAYSLALIINLANISKISGILLNFLLGLALWKRLKPILNPQGLYLISASLIAALLSAAFLLMYTGYIFSDLIYMPVVMLLSFFCSAAIFYLSNKKLLPQQKLIAFWLLVSYALASIIVWGPSNIYIREAAEWAKTQNINNLHSNNRAALFYAGDNPDKPLFNIHFLPDYDWDAQDLILYQHGRKEALPEELEMYVIIAEFANKHGDKIYALRLKNE